GARSTCAGDRDAADRGGAARHARRAHARASAHAPGPGRGGWGAGVGAFVAGVAAQARDRGRRRLSPASSRPIVGSAPPVVAGPKTQQAGVAHRPALGCRREAAPAELGPHDPSTRLGWPLALGLGEELVANAAHEARASDAALVF